MFTKVKVNGKTSIAETIKYYLSSGKKRAPVRGSAMKTLKGKPRKAYNLANKF